MSTPRAHEYCSPPYYRDLRSQKETNSSVCQWDLSESNVFRQDPNITPTHTLDSALTGSPSKWQSVAWCQVWSITSLPPNEQSSQLMRRDSASACPKFSVHWYCILKSYPSRTVAQRWRRFVEWLSNITTRQISHTSQSILLASLTCTHTHTHFDSTMWTPLTRLMWIDFFLTHLAHLSTIQIYYEETRSANNRLVSGLDKVLSTTCSHCVNTSSTRILFTALLSWP